MKAWALRPLPIAAATASSTAAGHDPAYVGNDYAGVVWKSAAGGASQSITLDMGEPIAADAALLFGCTGAAPGWTLTVEAGSDAGLGSGYQLHANAIPFLAGAEFSGHRRGVGWWDRADQLAARRYWRVTIGTPDLAAVTIARIVLGGRLALDRNFAFGAAFGVRDLGRVDWSPSAVLIRRRAPRLRTVGLTFPSVYKDEVEAKVQPLLELVGGQEPIAIVTDPSPHAMRQRRCYFGPLIGDLGTIWRSADAHEWRANLVDLFSVPAAS